jgi:Co/Zn/Cd efflux system component
VTLHATLRSEAGRDDALFEIQRLLETRFGIQHSTIQIEDSSCCASGSSCAP